MTAYVPPASVAGTIAVRLVPLTYVVASAVVPAYATVVGTKFVPVSVSVVADPASAEVGEIDVSVGAGLRIVNGSVLLVPPPGAGFFSAT